MVLDKLPVPGRPTNLDDLAVGAGWSYLHILLSCVTPSFERRPNIH